MVSLSEAIAKKVEDGGMSEELGEAVLHKVDVSNKIMRIYKHIAKSANSRFTAETLASASVEVFPWDAEGTSGSCRPIFFQQMPLDGFQSYDVPGFAIHELMDPREFSYNAQLKLGRCLSGSRNTSKDQSLHESTGWEGVKLNRRAYNECGDLIHNEEHRYQWHVFGMFAREDVPHLIVGSIHICEEPTRILRSELMIVLHAMWERGRSDKWIRHEVAPVLLISIRVNQFRIIEAYFNGSKLVVRFSDPIPMELTDSTESQQKTVNNLLRWLAAAPVGKTLKFSPASTDKLPVRR